jgi:formate hydrogenlyase subunit 3/multisubunit Na+/H+ antiporter MnhD subunit
VELLFTGILIKLAAIPVLFWLLSLADELPVLVLGLIISIVDMAAFGEFFMKIEHTGILDQNQPLILWIAALTSLLAALLMLTQKSLKRLLVLSTIEDVGFLLLGISVQSALGWSGVVFAASTHALAKALLFATLAAPEAAGELETEPVALASRYPVSAFGFLLGMLAMLGVPPLMGFLGRWRLYSAAWHAGPCPLAIFTLSSILALIAYVLALTRNWWGPSPHPDAPPAREPFALKAVLVSLVVLLAAAGIWPDALNLLFGGK